MKLEYTDDGIRIFLQEVYFKNIDLNDKDSLTTKLNYIFTYITRVYHFSMKGLYRIKIYKTKFGFIIDSILLDKDTYSGNDFEFKILVILNKNFYYKTEEYSLVKDFDYYYKDGFYYISLSEISNFINYSEFGSIVFDEEVK